jgi:hypothetical protein
MRSDQALALLRRTGFVVLVVAATMAKAHAGLSLDRAHGRVDASVHLLERWLGAGPSHAARDGAAASTAFSAGFAFALTSVAAGERQRAHAARFAALRSARPATARTRRSCAGAPRQRRSSARRGKVRRGCAAPRRAARKRRRAEPETRRDAAHVPHASARAAVTRNLKPALATVPEAGVRCTSFIQRTTAARPTGARS